MNVNYFTLHPICQRTSRYGHCNIKGRLSMFHSPCKLQCHSLHVFVISILYFYIVNCILFADNPVTEAVNVHLRYCSLYLIFCQFRKRSRLMFLNINIFILLLFYCQMTPYFLSTVECHLSKKIVSL
jgi:hypothetical protein